MLFAGMNLHCKLVPVHTENTNMVYFITTFLRVFRFDSVFDCQLELFDDAYFHRIALRSS